MLVSPAWPGLAMIARPDKKSRAQTHVRVVCNRPTGEFPMNPEQWTAVDRYITETFVPADPVLDAALRASAQAGLPEIHVSPNQGKLLMMLAMIRGARNILEIGTLAG